MSIIKQDYGEIGSGFDSPYITVPSNTDFIIVNTYTQSTNGVYDLSSNNAEIGVLQKVNDSFSSNGSYDDIIKRRNGKLIGQLRA